MTRHLSDYVGASALTILLATTIASGAVIVVDWAGGGDFETIQEAVVAAADGDTIHIAPGTYQERVTPVDKALLIRGSGANKTELTWAGTGTTLDITMPTWGSVEIEDLRIARVPDSESALHWDEHTIFLRDCEISGRAGGGMYYGAADVSNCTITRLGVGGGVRQTVINDSRIGRMGIGGIQFQAGNSLASTRTRYGELMLGCLMYASCVEDSIGRVEVPGGIDCYSAFHAEDSTIDMVVGTRSPSVELDRCIVGDVSCTYVWEEEYVPLSLRSCLVTGSVLVESEYGAAGAGAPARPLARNFAGLRLLHNTILGTLVYPIDVHMTWPPDAHWIRGNIVVGYTELYGGDHLVVSHNDFVGGASFTVPSDSTYANFNSNPRFCDSLGGDFELEDCSPCLGASYDGGDVGAFGVGCVCSTAVQELTWGAIKALYR